MGLNAILDGIKKSGQSQINDIQANAQAQVDTILRQAKIGADKIKKHMLAEGMSRINLERTRIQHKARLQALKITDEARQTLIEKVLDCTRQQLMQYRSNPRYPDVFRSLYYEAIEDLCNSLQKGESIRILADRRDYDILENLKRNKLKNVQICYEIDCWGGIIAESADGKVVVINTFEERLKRSIPFLKQYLAVFITDLPAG